MNTPVTEKPPPLVRWQRRVLTFCLVIFAFELGLFLVIFPWLRVWELSWIPMHSPRLANVWMSSYFRGALSGLGALNIYIAFTEGVRQIKMFIRQSGTSPYEPRR